MQWNSYEISSNVSLLFSELPYLRRFQAAAEAGFNQVESWWPFAEPHPGTAKLDEFVETVVDAGVHLTGLNFFAGDMPGGERGIACHPGRAGELAEATEALIYIARATGCKAFNLLYGQLDPKLEENVQHDRAIHAYIEAAEAVGDIDGIVLIEPLARGLNGAYPVTTVQDALKVQSAVGSDRVKLLFDTFHLASNGLDVTSITPKLAQQIGHVQIADSPGRGEPNSGDLNWTEFAVALKASGYRGSVAAEYKPTQPTLESLQWLKS